MSCRNARLSSKKKASNIVIVFKWIIHKTSQECQNFSKTCHRFIKNCVPVSENVSKKLVFFRIRSKKLLKLLKHMFEFKAEIFLKPPSEVSLNLRLNTRGFAKRIFIKKSPPRCATNVFVKSTTIFSMKLHFGLF